MGFNGCIASSSRLLTKLLSFRSPGNLLLELHLLHLKLPMCSAILPLTIHMPAINITMILITTSLLPLPLRDRLLPLSGTIHRISGAMSGRHSWSLLGGDVDFTEEVGGEGGGG